MAKGIDQFSAFKAATLQKSPSLSDAVKQHTDVIEPVQAVVQTPTPVQSEITKPSSLPINPKTSKLDGKEQVAFYLPGELKRKLGFIKYQYGISFNDLYEEAIRDLITKYENI